MTRPAAFCSARISTIVETRRLGMFERMSAAPVRPRTIIAGESLTYVVIAAVQDPDIERWAKHDRPEWAGDAFRRAAAVNALNTRARAIARLPCRGQPAC